MTQLPPDQPPTEATEPSEAEAAADDKADSPADHATSPRSNRTPLVVAVAVVAVVAIVGGLFVAIGGDDDGSSDSSGSSGGDTEAAEATVRGYFQAIVDKDCRAIFGAVTESSWSDTAGSPDEAIAQCEDAVAAGQLDLDGEATLDDLQVTDQTDDALTFEATETIAGDQLTETFTVVREDGEWKLDLTRTAG